MTEVEFFATLAQQGPLVAILGSACVVLWRHILSEDKKHSDEVEKINAVYREDVKALTATFTASIDRNTEALANHDKMMHQWNNITKGLSENLYSNLVLKAKEGGVRKRRGSDKE